MASVRSPAGITWVKTVDCCAKLIQGWELQAGIAGAVDLIVGQFVEDDPEYKRAMCGERLRGRRRDRGDIVEVARLPAHPESLQHQNQAEDCDVAESR